MTIQQAIDGMIGPTTLGFSAIKDLLYVKHFFRMASVEWKDQPNNTDGSDPFDVALIRNEIGRFDDHVVRLHNSLMEPRLCYHDKTYGGPLTPTTITYKSTRRKLLWYAAIIRSENISNGDNLSSRQDVRDITSTEALREHFQLLAGTPHRIHTVSSQAEA
jgi:hypothetical protein